PKRPGRTAVTVEFPECPAFFVAFLTLSSVWPQARSSVRIQADQGLVPKVRTGFTKKGPRMLSRLIAPTADVSAHCDLPCGVYDPAQARIEAQSVKACMEKYNSSDDADFRARALAIKEERSDLVKHHLWVLWTDYFKPPHFEKYPQLHQLFNEATKLAGAGGTKGTNDPAVAD